MSPARKSANTARNDAPRRPRGRPRQSSGEPLVNWEDPEPHTQVLDWRGRAKAFGLGPLEASDEESEGIVATPDRLIREDDPEALESQNVEGDPEELESGEVVVETADLSGDADVAETESSAADVD